MATAFEQQRRFISAGLRAVLSKRVQTGFASLGSALAAALLLGACTDGATRIANDIESGVNAFTRSGETSTSIKHVPEASPDGCAGPYTVQLSERSSLLIWCKDPATMTIVASHTTTYHLRFVDVPQQFSVDKATGEPLLIDIEKRGGKVVVVGLH